MCRQQIRVSLLIVIASMVLLACAERQAGPLREGPDRQATGYSTSATPAPDRTPPAADATPPSPTPAAAEPTEAAHLGRSLPTDPSRLQLIAPSVGSLLHLLKMANEDPGAFGEGEDFLLARQDFAEVVGLLLAHYYPDGLSPPQEVLAALAEGCGGCVLPDILAQLLADAVLDDLQRPSMVLEEGRAMEGRGYQLSAYRLELDGDEGREWLLRVEFPGIMSLIWMVVDETGEAGFRPLPVDAPPLLGVEQMAFLNATPPRVILAQDFTGDGLTDVILQSTTFFLERENNRFEVYQGSAQGLELLSVIDAESRTQRGEYVEYTIADPVVLSEPVLTMTIWEELNWGCGWKVEHSFLWPNGVERSTRSAQTPPATPECLLAEVFNDFTMDPAAHIPKLERALAGFGSAGGEAADKAQFARFRLAVLYALQDDEARAKEHLQVFLDGYTKGRYEGTELAAYLRQSIQPLAQGAELDPFALCQAVANKGDLFEGWVPFLIANQVFPGNTFSGQVLSPLVCPAGDLALRLMRGLSFDPATSPQEPLRAAGLPVAAAVAYPFSPTTPLAWFVYLTSSPPMVFAYLPGDGDFEWQLVYQGEGDPDQLSWFAGDVTGDGVAEIAFAAPLNSPPSWCEQGTAYDIFAVAFVGEGKTLFDHRDLCVPGEGELDLSAFMADKDGDGRVDWAMEEIVQYTDDQQALFERLGARAFFHADELQELLRGMDISRGGVGAEISDWREGLLAGQDPIELREKLEAALAQLMQSAEPFTPMRQQIRYWIGFSYELQGKDLQAIESYLALVEADPHTLWGDLAAARLAEKGQ